MMLLLLFLFLICHTSPIMLPIFGDMEGNGLKYNNGGDSVNFFHHNSGERSEEDEGYITGDPLWVLHLKNDGWMDPKLALGTSEDQDDFYYAVAPMIRRAAARDTSTSVFKKKPNNSQQALNDPTTPSDTDLKNEIMKIINKFALSTSLEPDSYLTGNVDEKDPAIALYFKGPISCFIIILGEKQWHYILESKPFPSWFYETHDTFEAPLKVPENLRNMFFKVLLRMLKLMLSYPV